MSSHGETTPLLGSSAPAPVSSTTSTHMRATYFTCTAIFLVGCLALSAAVLGTYESYSPPHNITTVKPDTHGSLSRAAAEAPLNQSSTSGDSLSFSVFSLMVWGSPGSFGVLDKERRMAALGSWMAQDSDHDVYLLNDLWMRADHGIIRHSLPEGYEITNVGDLADEKCDGVAAPEFCSGLTVVSKHPIKNVEFLPFTDHGDFFWDYEYFLRRGAGVVTLEPRPGHTVAVVVTSLASIDYNYWYREHQAADLMQFLRHSTVLAADHLIVAGDFNVDPRDNEDTYKSIHADGLLTNANPHPEDCDSKSSTLGNPRNTYTEKGQKPVVYDYIWYKPAGTTLNEFKVLNLITQKEEISLSDHQALSAKFTLTKSS